MAAAEAVLAPSAEAPVEALAALADASLLRVVEPEGFEDEARIAHYESARELASGELAAQGPDHAARRRHAEYSRCSASGWPRPRVETTGSGRCLAWRWRPSTWTRVRSSRRRGPVLASWLGSRAPDPWDCRFFCGRSQISQRELRNESAAVMDAVERGETLVVTRNGHPVAELRPVPRRTFVPTTELLQRFRDLPQVSLDELRAESDVLLDSDRLDG
jgi:prevent-host-death family protein